MDKANSMQVRIFRSDPEGMQNPKDEEYAYWQARPAIERLLAMQELSFGFFEE
jgi:hypothetical protein